jgi:antitoxin component HigA of HigAB toxin-antitoxin module
MAANTKPRKQLAQSGSFEQLVRRMPPMAIRDDAQHAITVEVIDKLMQVNTPSQAQSDYAETLVQLVEAYESKRHAIDLSKLGGSRMLKHVLGQSGMSASDLARLLGVHPTMGSKILAGDRRLTWDHAKILGARFKVAPALFMA